ncbi:hypothetical protein ACQKE9_00370 [Shewanella vesiculosa]|uniref:hypothetical protein n=1 Tax=Shewanella vesiculosa TaxID=518738 RepID=UPI003D0808C6
MDLAIELLKLACVGILSGVFGAFMALRRYKHEKWWEMRVNAYKNVMESLADMTAIYEGIHHWDQNSKDPEDISIELKSARAKVRKHRDMGAFLFSSEAEIALTKFIEFDVDYTNVTEPDDIYGPFSLRSRECLDKIVALSKKDLAVNECWL